MEPFEGLRPAPSLNHLDRLRGGTAEPLCERWDLPTGFEAYARVLHRSPDGPWSEIDPVRLTRADGVNFCTRYLACDGILDEDLLLLLLDRLTAHTAATDDCHFEVWGGWGTINLAWEPESHWPFVRTTSTWASASGGHDDLRPKLDLRSQRERAMLEFLRGCPHVDLDNGRGCFYVDGPLGAITSIGTPGWEPGEVHRVGVSRWWPADRSWLVATDMDGEWTYVAGSRQLIDQILAEPPVDAVEVFTSDTW